LALAGNSYVCVTCVATLKEYNHQS